MMLPNKIRQVEASETAIHVEMDRMDTVDLFCIVEHVEQPYAKRLADALFYGMQSGDDPTTIEVVYNGTQWPTWYEKFETDLDSDQFTVYQWDLLQAFVRDVTAEVDA